MEKASQINIDKRFESASVEVIPSPLSMLYKWEASKPEARYLTQPTSKGIKTFNWQETACLARKVAAKLLQLNLPPNSRIAILGKNSAEWMIADYGIMMAGYVSVPIFSTAGVSTIKYVIDHADCQLVFVGKLDNMDEQVAAIPEGITTIGLPYENIIAQQRWDEFIDIAPLTDSPVPPVTNIMTIIYTSGSTGQPKGVVHSFESIGWAGFNSLSSFNFTASDRIMSYLPLAHITERALVQLASLYSSMEVYFVESLETFNRDVKACQPTLFISVPRLWTKFQLGVLAKMSQRKLDFLLNVPFLGGIVSSKIRAQLGLSQARLSASGSAPLPVAVTHWFTKIGINISEGWGMTENAAYGTGAVPFRHDKIGTIGRAYAGVRIRIAEDGEIQVKSPCNMIEYYKDAEKTAGAFTNDGYFRTGDKGRIDEDGYVFITGRLKDIFKTTKGKYVTPAPIEAKLMQNSKIEQVCVTGNGLPQPIALVVLSDDASATSKSENEASLNNTLASLNSTLESHQKLDRILVFSNEWSIDNELLTPTLKVKRHVVEEKFKVFIASQYHSTVVWIKE